MTIRLKVSPLSETNSREYLVRFALGGAMTVVAGLIAAGFGGVLGGLFLAFPAIFPASVTLVEKHVRERKGPGRGKEEAALDALSAALGSFGLAVFAAVVWLAIGRIGASVLFPATAAWFAVAATLLQLRRRA
jgi:hypothetical protein